MEEYRAWVVDRTIIKIRKELNSETTLNQNVKRAIVSAIDETMASKILYKSKRLKLENVMQRQAYRLAATIMGKAKYKGITFKW